MSEAWAAVILPLFEAIASDPQLQLNRRQQEMLPQIVEHHLRVIEGGETPISDHNIKQAGKEAGDKLTKTQKKQIGI